VLGAEPKQKKIIHRRWVRGFRWPGKEGVIIRQEYWGGRGLAFAHTQTKKLGGERGGTRTSTEWPRLGSHKTTAKSRSTKKIRRSTSKEEEERLPEGGV